MGVALTSLSVELPPSSSYRQHPRSSRKVEFWNLKASTKSVKRGGWGLQWPLTRLSEQLPSPSFHRQHPKKDTRPAVFWKSLDIFEFEGFKSMEFVKRDGVAIALTRLSEKLPPPSFHSSSTSASIRHQRAIFFTSWILEFEGFNEQSFEKVENFKMKFMKRVGWRLHWPGCLKSFLLPSIHHQHPQKDTREQSFGKVLTFC